MSDRDFSLGIKFSLIFHLALAILILLESLIFPSKAIPYIPTLRVDLVGLPDILKKDLAHVPKTAEAEAHAKDVKQLSAPKVEETAKPDEMVLHPKRASNDKLRRKRMESALERIKALAKISQMEESQKPPAILIKGNKVSKGSSLSGDAREQAQASYYDQLRDRFQEYWALPVWIARQNYSAQVQVYIDAAGRLVSYRFIKASGNEQFDAAVKETLKQSQPFPIPPEAIRDSLVENGISVGFPL